MDSLYHKHIIYHHNIVISNKKRYFFITQVFAHHKSYFFILMYLHVKIYHHLKFVIVWNTSCSVIHVSEASKFITNWTHEHQHTSWLAKWTTSLIYTRFFWSCIFCMEWFRREDHEFLSVTYTFKLYPGSTSDDAIVRQSKVLQTS